LILNIFVGFGGDSEKMFRVCVSVFI